MNGETGDPRTSAPEMLFQNLPILQQYQTLYNKDLVFVELMRKEALGRQ
jgi:hypothetical protein